MDKILVRANNLLLIKGQVYSSLTADKVKFCPHQRLTNLLQSVPMTVQKQLIRFNFENLVINGAKKHEKTV